LVERLSKETDEGIKNRIASQYWNDEVVDDAIVENYVNEARVIRVVCKDEKIRNNTKRYMYNSPTIPNIPILEDE
jgi:hypothetical protein